MATKPIQWKKNGNRQIIDTGDATFDRQVSGLCTGNVIGNTQLSWYIRSEKQTECNGYTFQPGELRDYDLAHFGDLPNNVRDRVIAETRNKSIILYEIHHWIRNDEASRKWEGRISRKIIHGYILTDTNHKLIFTFVTNKLSFHLMDTVLPYLADLE